MADDRKKSKLELLQEAKALEDLGGEWTPKHAAAFCNVSESFLRRSSCPKKLKAGAGATLNHLVHYDPKDVRTWNAARTLRNVA